ncbi:hypothetical protein PVAP13_3KG237900 [Panicum virgatum]|uniref:Secreted protein n=1 Tax=Panicum virgatum TaxID=38727 RepID=A0A8T0UWE1_PANVG|nr:hypothetical protein PVAP13_3KG237900 [Panicum virgatum]
MLLSFLFFLSQIVRRSPTTPFIFLAPTPPDARTLQHLCECLGACRGPGRCTGATCVVLMRRGSVLLPPPLMPRAPHTSGPCSAAAVASPRPVRPCGAEVA